MMTTIDPELAVQEVQRVAGELIASLVGRLGVQRAVAEELKAQLKAKTEEVEALRMQLSVAVGAYAGSQIG